MSTSYKGGFLRDDLTGALVISVGSNVEVVPSGAVSHIFQPHQYGVVADAIVDAEGSLVSGTDDTAAWLNLIAALPADKAVIRLHGISVISNPNALSYALGFNTSRLTIIGDGPHSGFYLADNANCTPLLFNTTTLNGGPPILERIRLERFAVYGNGYNQSDPGAGSGVQGIQIYCARHVRIKGLLAHTCRNVGVQVLGYTDALVDDLTVDTVVGGTAANGINLDSGTSLGWRSHSGRVINSTFIDVPNEPIYLAGKNQGQITQDNNEVRYRNLRPQPPSVTGWLQQWQNATQAAPAWSNLTNYSPSASSYTVVSQGGFNYLCVQPSGPGNGGAVTPGTDQRYWWLQNKPLAWNAATAYVMGQCAWYTTPTNPGSEAAWSNLTNYAINQAVLQGGIPYVAAAASGPGNGGAVTPGTNSAVWAPSTQLPGGWRVNLTAQQANTNVTPVTAHGTLMPQWNPGGPEFGTAANGLALEASASLPNEDVSITNNRAFGRNWNGELVGNVGIYASYSGAAGVAMRSLAVLGNLIRGYNTAIQITGDEGTVIEGNPIEDCTNGIMWGDSAGYLQRQIAIAKNPIRLGGLGNGTGLQAAKTGTGGGVYGLGVEGNEVDGGGAMFQLSAGITTASNPYASIPVTATDVPLYPGQALWIGGPLGGQFAGGTTVTVSAYTPPGSTSIPITSTTFAGNISSGTPVVVGVTTLTTAITSGVGFSSLAVAALPFPIQPGQTLAVCITASATTPQQVQVAAQAPFGLGPKLQDTSVPLVTTYTPSHTFPVGSPVIVLGGSGISLSGGITAFSGKSNHIRAVGNFAFLLSTGTNTPQDGELVDNRMIYAAGGGYNIGSVGTATPVRVEGGSVLATGGNVLPTSGVQVRNVWGITPAQNVATPAVPATGTAATMPIYDGILSVTAAAGGATTIGLGTTTQASNQDTATITVPASATVLIPVKAGQKVYATYGANTPTWQYFAQ